MKNVDFEVVPFEKLSVDEWDSFVQESDEGWFWHTHYFIQAWPHDKNLSFAIKNNGVIVLVQTLWLRGTTPKWHIDYFKGIPFPRYKNKGFVQSLGCYCKKNGINDKLTRKLAEFYRVSLINIISEYRIRNFDALLPTLAYSYWPNRCPLINPLIYFGQYKNNISQAYVISLDKSEEEIFGAYAQTTRNLIYRGQKDESIKIEEAKPCVEDLTKYYDLHVETYRRTGAVPHQKSYFEHIFLDILKEGYCRILFLYRDGKLVAAHNTLIYKQVAMYWTGASISERGDIENRMLMHDQIINAKRQGCRYFEVGEAFPNVFDGKLKGLSDFKKNFGGSLHPMFKGEFSLR